MTLPIVKAALVLALLLIVPLLAVVRSLESPPANWQIVYADGDQVWISDLDGGRRAALDVWAKAFRCSSNGAYLAHLDGSRITLVNAVESSSRTVEVDFQHFAYSYDVFNDGRRVLLTLDRDEGRGFYTLDLISGTGGWLPTGFVFAQTPILSPDDARMVFTGDYYGTTSLRQFVVTLAVPQSAAWLGYGGSVLDWSPDGTMWLRRMIQRSGRIALGLYDLAGDQTIIVANQPAVSYHDGLLSPDGRYLLARGQHDDGARLELFDLSAHNRRLLTPPSTTLGGFCFLAARPG